MFPPMLKDDLESLERQRIIEAVSSAQGNVTHAAKELGIPRRTLWFKLRKYELDANDYRPKILAKRPTTCPHCGKRL